MNKNIPGRFQHGMGWCLELFEGWRVHLSGLEVQENVFGGRGIFSATMHMSHSVLRT